MSLDAFTEGWTLHLPVRLEFGVDCLTRLPQHLAGIRNVIVLTGKTAMKKAGVVDQIGVVLGQAGIQWQLYDHVSPDPDYQEVQEAAEMARAIKAQAVIGCGGGSAIDAAKATAVAACHEGRVLDYTVQGTRTITAATLPIYAITSTSGTGSHVGRAAVISDKSNHVKRVLLSDYLYPQTAFCDPLILQHMPSSVTAATGFDAFAQALEGYLTNVENPMGNLCALEAMRIILRTLPHVVRDGSNLRLRSEMAWADTLAGVTLATNSISTPHVLSMIIGARYGATHGPAIASVTIPWLCHLRDAGCDKIRVLDDYIKTCLDTPEKGSESPCIGAVSALIASIGLNKSPVDCGMPIDDIEDISREAKQYFSFRLDFDPLSPDETKIAQILSDACR